MNPKSSSDFDNNLQNSSLTSILTFQTNGCNGIQQESI